MRQKLLKTMRTFLVAAGLCVGTGAWAVSNITTVTGIVGATDNSSGFNVIGSKNMSLASGDNYVITFVNNNKGVNGAQYWENWAFISNVFNCRADHGASNPYWGSATNVSYTGSSWTDISSTITDWLQAYNGVTVTLTISRNSTGDGITISHNATTKAVGSIASQTYSGSFNATVNAADAINFYLTSEYAHLKILNVVYNNTEFNYMSSESAYVDQGNSTTNYNGESVDNLLLYSTQYRDWGNSDGTMKFNTNGKMALYKFDLAAIKNKLANDGGTITGVKFSVYGKGDGGTCGSIRVLGYNPEWNSSTVTQANLTNNSGTITGLVTSTGSFQPLNETGGRSLEAAGTTLEENALTYVRSAIEEKKDYVTIALAANYTRTGILNTCANLQFTYAKATLYEATFSEANSLNPAITVYKDEKRTSEIEKNQLSANTTYYFKATLAGYNDYEGSFDVESSNPTVNFTMTLKTRYTFTINAVDAESNVIKAIYSDADSYEGKTHSIVYPKYLTGSNNIVTHYKNSDTYGESKTAQAQDETYTVGYTAYIGVAYFVEVEDVVSGTKYNSWFCSNGAAVRGFTTAANIFTIPANGTYDITYGICNNNVNYDLSCTLSKNDTEIATKDDLKAVSINYIRTTGIVNVNNISLLNGDVLKLTPSTTNGIVDYMLIELKSVGGTIATSGYSSLASAYGLDFASATGLTAAYVVTKTTNDAVTLTSVDELPANSGVILKGTAGAAYSIPVKADAAYPGTNLLSAAVTATDIEANTAYILKDGKFCLVDAASTVPAGKAYLLKSNVPSAARALGFVFEDEITGINAVNRDSKSVEFFNLQGQRVDNPRKGLYIVNGKKVLVK